MYVLSLTQMIAFPLYAFLLPIYSFWHMDDFSWGNTRIVVGEKGNKKVVAGTDDEPYDDSMIPRKRFTEYQQEILAAGDAPRDTLLYEPTRDARMMTPDPEYPDYFQHTNLLEKGKGQRQSLASSQGPRDSMTPSMYTAPHPMSMYGMPPTMSMYGMPPTMSMYGMPPMGMPPPMYGMPPWNTPTMRPMSGASAAYPSGHSVLPEDPTRDPSDEQLRAAIRSYLAAQPTLMNVTKRDVREALATSMPNADLTSRRTKINMMIDELLSGG